MKAKECPFCGLSGVWIAGTPPISLDGCSQCRTALPPELWNKRFMPECVRVMLINADANAEWMREQGMTCSAEAIECKVKAVREYYGEAAT